MEEMLKQGITFVIKCPSQSFQENYNIKITSLSFLLWGNPSRLVQVIEVKIAGELLEESGHFMLVLVLPASHSM